MLHIVKNYTGDVLNFQMAAELLGDEGIEASSVLVNDDVAVEDSLYTAGRRGTGATVFVEKIAGALAERGADLRDGGGDGRTGEREQSLVRRGAERVHHPGRRGARLRARRGEIELGIGIHGEPGRTRARMATAREIAEIAARRDPRGPRRSPATCW